MAAPVFTLGAVGNAKTSASLAASGTFTFTVDFSSVFEGQLQISATFGTVAATAGLQIQIFPIIGATPATDTVAAAGSFVLGAVTSTTQLQTTKLGTGKYSVKLTNLDATNGLTLVLATYDTISGVA